MCRGAMDSKQSVDISKRKEVGYTPQPSLRGGTFGHFYIHCYVRWAQHLCEGAELSVGDKYSRGYQALCRFGLSCCTLASGRLDSTLASFYSLTLGITP